MSQKIVTKRCNWYWAPTTQIKKHFEIPEELHVEKQGTSSLEDKKSWGQFRLQFMIHILGIHLPQGVWYMFYESKWYLNDSQCINIYPWVPLFVQTTRLF